MRLVVVSGLSGSGKSVALDVLEDLDFYCVDNIPAGLLPGFIAYTVRTSESSYRQTAVGLDVRNRPEDLAGVPELIVSLRKGGIGCEMLFLRADKETLVKRFSETRRRHPMSDGTHTLTESIEQERALLAEVRGGGFVFDTSDLPAAALRAWIKDFVAVDPSRLTLLFESFGFKHGVPLDADLVFDVRCLPNPFYEPDLRSLTGRDAPVIDFLEAESEVLRMRDDIARFVATWLPCYVRDHRNYLTVGIGCTGGQHRSVYFCEWLGSEFRDRARVLVRHRELEMTPSR